MFAPLKRIMILAAALMVPGVAFSYVSVYEVNVDNTVPAGSAGFVVGVEAMVDPDDSWQSTHFEFDNYNDVCLDHDDFGPGDHKKVFYVEFDNENAVASDLFDLTTYNDDNCGNLVRAENTEYTVYNVALTVEQYDEWRDVTQFMVNKVFRPSSDMDIQVNINCSAGDPGDDTAIMNGDGLHIFPQEFLNPGNPNHNCVITEDNVPAGYQAFYVIDPAGDILQSSEGCFFYGSGNMRSNNICQIVNVGLPATFTVTKLWEVFQDDDANFVELDELRVRLGAWCNRDIISGNVVDQLSCSNGCSFTNPGMFLDHKKANWVVTGDAYLTVTVDNSGLEPVECFGVESVYYSNVERTFTDCSTFENGVTVFEMGPGESAGCTFVNTVFFEGIPTLSQYGMAIMALLMLGVGFVGFRRFV